MRTDVSCHVFPTSLSLFWLEGQLQWSVANWRRISMFHVQVKAPFTQDAQRDAQRNASKWDLLSSMGVFTLHASNIKGFAFQFAWASRVKLLGLSKFRASFHPNPGNFLSEYFQAWSCFVLFVWDKFCAVIPGQEAHSKWWWCFWAHFYVCLCYCAAVPWTALPRMVSTLIGALVFVNCVLSGWNYVLPPQGKKGCVGKYVFKTQQGNATIAGVGVTRRGVVWCVLWRCIRRIWSTILVARELEFVKSVLFPTWKKLWSFQSGIRQGKWRSALSSGCAKAKTTLSAIGQGQLLKFPGHRGGSRILVRGAMEFWPQGGPEPKFYSK